MAHWKRGAVLGVMSILALAIAGCDIRWVNVMIPDFQSKEVEGVWIWLSPGTAGTFSHELQVAVPRQIVSAPGAATPTGEWLNVRDSTGHPQVLLVFAHTDAAKPDQVTVQIGVMTPFYSGYVKVSTYNVAGESPVSDGETSL